MLFASVYAIFSAPRNIVWRLEHRISQGQNRVFFSRRIFEKIHRLTIFPCHEDFAKATSCSANSSSIQIFRSIFCSIFLQKIRLEHNSMRSIAPLSLDIPLSLSIIVRFEERPYDRSHKHKKTLLSFRNYNYASTRYTRHEQNLSRNSSLWTFLQTLFPRSLKKKGGGGGKKEEEPIPRRHAACRSFKFS